MHRNQSRMRINNQLSVAESGAHLWADRRARFSREQALGDRRRLRPSSRRRWIASASIIDGRIYRPPGLGSGYPLSCRTPKVGLELGDDAKHVSKSLARGRRCVDRLLRRLQSRGALCPQRANGVLEISDGSPSGSTRVRMSPGRKKSKIVRSSARLSVVVPLRFSTRTISHPDPFSALS